MNVRRHVLLGILLFAAGAAALLYLADRARRSRSGAEYAFYLGDSPAFLTEALALAKACEALDLDGLEAASWRVVVDGRTTAPDGRPDEFMGRNSLDPNRGAFLFAREDHRVRCVIVELRGNWVICQTCAGK